MARLVLASRSPARAHLLAAAGVAVEIRRAEVDEAALKRNALAAGADPRGVACALADAKACAVQAEGLVIGADQTLDLDGTLFDKPTDLAAARRHLLALRGRSHRLHSAVSVARGGEVVWSGVDTVTLQVRAFSDDFLQRYLDTEGDALLGCVGAYRLEGLGAQLFERLEGDYFCVLGLPLLTLLDGLRELGALAA